MNTKTTPQELARLLREDVDEWNRRRDDPSWRPNLYGADLRRARIGEYTLTGRHITAGPVRGYTALMFAAETEPVVRAGCYTGPISGLVNAARDECFTASELEEVELVVAYLEGLAKLWEAGA